MATGTRHGPVLRHRGRIKGLCFSPDSQLLAAGGTADLVNPQTGTTQALTGEVQLWRVSTGWAAGPALWHPRPVWCVSFSPDGRVLVTRSDTAVRFFLPMSGQRIGRELGGEGTVTNLRWNSAGTLAVFVRRRRQSLDGAVGVCRATGIAVALVHARRRDQSRL